MHSVNYARENSDIIDDLIITTDDPVIIEIAKNENIRVVTRPKELATDNSTTLSAIKHVLEVVENEYKYIFLFQPTNPLRPKGLLKKCWLEYCQNNSDSLFTVSRNHHKLGKVENNKFEPFNYKFGQRSQDLQPLYFENGLVYITKAEVIKKQNQLLGKNNFAYIVEDSVFVVDIDTELDFKLAMFYINNFR